MNVSELLARNARKYPLQEAVIDGADRLTYQELDQTVTSLSHQLRSLGVEKGDKVVLFSPNCKEFLYVYFAVLRVGGVIVPINARLTASEIDYILDHSDAKMMVTHQALFESVRELPSRHDITWIKTGEVIDSWLSLEQLIESGETTPIECALTEEDEATILYTSGTTGKPKGVLFTYRNLLTVAVMICVEMGVGPFSRFLHMMPLSHSAPLHLFLLAGTYAGSTHVLSPTFTPDLLLQLVSRERITHFFGAPIAFLLTANHPEIDQYDLSSIQYWLYGGAPLGQQEVQFVKQKFNTSNLMCLYGLTEAGPSGTLLQPEEHEHKAGSVGRRAALNCELRIVDDKGNDVVDGEIGEIILSGEGTMKGYYKNPQETENTIKGRWLYTGDMAKRDEDGYIWIVDRKKDMIISGGQNIYPKEIEDTLRMHPAIMEVAVVGVPHPEWGETVKAVLVLKEHFEENEIAEECKRFLADKLASFKVPRSYQIMTELPRNATGKILKTQLRA
ncbi:class I adenylate-forming enzyme family protein [Brevibacillus sp. SYSU BS000544]|uniref:class I adenylate-forming enzyme family protein n=1 Tax=Brevibacillus sp. SYSU BS000544 TaxID=3416443 RepID=UPI003CE4F607